MTPEVTIKDIGTVHISSRQPVLLDTNVWLAIYPATSNSTAEAFARVYTDFLSKLIKWTVPIVSNIVVLGEYVNRFCRIEHDAYCRSYKNLPYKDYRGTDDFKYTASEAADCAHDILNTPGLVFRGVGNEEFDETALLDDFKQGETDFNDGLLARLCVANGWPLVTNDADFKGMLDGLVIWTALPKLLKTSKHP